MANKHVVSSHFKEEYMQPLQPFAMRHVNEIQVSPGSSMSLPATKTVDKCGIYVLKSETLIEVRRRYKK